jgi:putative phage-type endonuclease
MILKPADRKSWLAARQQGLGGSDAGAAIGANKYKSNVDLWREKAGLTEPEDISDKPAVKFGKQAEEHIRALFMLEHPEFTVDYHEFYMYLNDKFPFIYATLDGELTDENGRRGILEIKTATIQNPSQWNEWFDDDGYPKIPDSYYAQILHQLAATGWEYVVLVAYIRVAYAAEGNAKARIFERRVERVDVEADINFLVGQEAAFWQAVKDKKQPPRLLPEI